MEELMEFLRYEGKGWVIAVIALIAVIVLGILNSTRLGLMNCPLQKRINAIFRVLLVIVIVFMLFACMNMVISLDFIPLLVTLFILFFLGRKIIISVWADIRGTHGYFKVKRKNRWTENYNKKRIAKTGVSQNLISTVLRENTGKVSILRDGVFLDNNGTSESPMLAGLFVGSSADCRSIKFAELGYGEMDENAMRALSALVSEGLSNYDCKELITSANRKVTYTTAGTPTTGTISSSGHVMINEGTSGDSETYEIKIPVIYGYQLIRKDIAQAEVSSKMSTKNNLKQW